MSMWNVHANVDVDHGIPTFEVAERPQYRVIKIHNIPRMP